MDISIGNEKSPIKRLKANEVLFCEGDKAEFIYVVAEGDIVGVREHNKRLTPVLHAQVKSVLGMEAISSNEGKYLYSAISKTSCEVVPIEIELVRNFFNHSSELMKDLLATLVSKVVHTTELLSEHRIIDESLNTGQLFTDEEEAALLALLKK